MKLIAERQVRVVSLTFGPSCLGSQPILRSRVRPTSVHSRDYDQLTWFHRNDPTPDRGSQLPRAASLIISSLGFIHDLRAGLLEADTVRGTPLDMDQYTRLFGTARIPTERGCRMETHHEARHIVVLRRGQFCMSISLYVNYSAADPDSSKTGLMYWIRRTDQC